MKHSYPTVLTIAGSDSSGGAGIQADIKSISATGAYAATVISALTAQNTLGVQAIREVPTSFVEQQLHSVFTDLRIHAVKIGMLGNPRMIQCIAKVLQIYSIKNIVVDPVMVSTQGNILLKKSSIRTLSQCLLPLAFVITPNVPEAEKLLGKPIQSKKDMEYAAVSLANTYQTSVLVKGGHCQGPMAIDIFYDFAQGACHRLVAPWVNTLNTHGTGCTLSAAIASYLAQGKNLLSAIQEAKRYLTEALVSGKNFQLGRGCGPVNHFYFCGVRTTL